MLLKESKILKKSTFERTDPRMSALLHIPLLYSPSPHFDADVCTSASNWTKSTLEMADLPLTDLPHFDEDFDETLRKCLASKVHISQS